MSVFGGASTGPEAPCNSQAGSIVLLAPHGCGTDFAHAIRIQKGGTVEAKEYLRADGVSAAHHLFCTDPGARDRRRALPDHLCVPAQAVVPRALLGPEQPDHAAGKKLFVYGHRVLRHSPMERR